MKKGHVVLSCIILLFILLMGGIIVYAVNGGISASSFSSQNPLKNQTSQQTQQQVQRQPMQVPLQPDNTNQQPVTVAATKLPEFVYSLVDHKFDAIITAASDQINTLIQVKIAYAASLKDTIDATVSVDKEKKQLVVTPNNGTQFTPGLYKLSLTLRTLEGVVHIDQNFSWGVIAVNTNKSIYKPGETAKLGIGVLNDKGQTMCMTGLFDHVDNLSMTITDPNGNPTNFSIKDKTITDSGKCGPSTVTNDADFQAKYQTTTPGIYQMTTTAVVYGKQRQIEDYFKVDPNVQFDVERTSFPTRIYPPAPYPVTFTVTASSDYNGKITDIVPAFFSIEHIDDNGKTENDGNFTKIIWNTQLTAGKPKMFTYYIGFPQVSPEFYLVGPIIIGSFTEARQWQIASDAINSSTGVFTCEDNGSSNTWYRKWTGTTWNPALGSGATSMSTLPADSRWFSEKSSPTTGEKLVALIDNNNGTTPLPIYMFHFDPATGNWSQDFKMTLPVSITTSNSRFMDIAYDQLSGDALFVYNANETQNRYLTRTPGASGTWGVSGTVASTVGTLFGTVTSAKTWIRLVAQSKSDAILLSYVSTGSHVGAEVWNGSSWSNELPDNVANSPTTTATTEQEVMSSAWETTSGTPMIAWGNGSTGVTYRRLTGGTWQNEATTGLTGFNTNAFWISLAADDASNRLAMSISTSGATPNCYFAIWDGSSWTQAGSGIGCRQQVAGNGGDGTINNRPINVVWEHGTGHAVWVYNTAAAPTFLHYRIWDGAFEADTSMGSTAQTNPISIQLYSDPYSVGIIVMYSMGDISTNGTAGVYDREWDGSSWTGVNANPLFANIQNSYEHTEAWGFGFDLNLETQAAYRWFANAPGTDTSVTTALAPQDTSYTLSTASQKFRLRLLLYYPDTLSSGTRNYILQYVDPGGGTCANPSGGSPPDWSDVPNVNDANITTVAYFDNSSVASASAVTANAGLDPTYNGDTKVAETYNEQNQFTTNAAVTGGQVGLFDFSLVDKTTFGRTAHTFCFRVERSNRLPLQINKYAQITTASQNDVLIQGRTLIQGKTLIQ